MLSAYVAEVFACSLCAGATCLFAAKFCVVSGIPYPSQNHDTPVSSDSQSINSKHSRIASCFGQWNSSPLSGTVHAKLDKPDRKKLGGSWKENPKKSPTTVYDWAGRAFEKLVFIYERFSTREQKLKNAYSRERQDRLKQQALQQGAT